MVSPSTIAGSTERKCKCGHSVQVHAEKPKSDACSMCACAKFAFGPRAFGEIWCLTLFGQDGGFVGFFYHPNREAVDQKARELRQDFSQSKYAQVIDRYVLDEVRR